MAEEQRFCTNCGVPLVLGGRFCASCGHEIEGAAPGPAAKTNVPPAQVSQPATSGEQLIGIIPAVSRRKGLMSTEGFNIVVTDRRMIFAAMTPEMIKEAGKEKGKDGFIAGILGAATAGYDLWERYLTISPEAALKENPQNFFVELSQVKKVKLEPGSSRRDNIRGVEVYESSHLEIETSGEKYSFLLPSQFHGKAQDVIHKAGLPQK